MIKLADILKEIQETNLTPDEENFIRVWVIAKSRYSDATPNQKKKLIAIYSDWFSQEKDQDPDASAVSYFNNIDQEEDYIELKDLASYTGYGYDKDDSQSSIHKMLQGDDEEVTKHADRIASAMKKYGAKDLDQLDKLSKFSLNESKNPHTYQLKGILTTNTEVRTQGEILSDMRAIPGVTIVTPKDYQGGDTPIENNRYTVELSVKIDPHPFKTFGKEQIKNIIDQIKRVDGVVVYKPSKIVKRIT